MFRDRFTFIFALGGKHIGTEAEEIILQHEINTDWKYSIYKKDKLFDTSEYNLGERIWRYNVYTLSIFLRTLDTKKINIVNHKIQFEDIDNGKGKELTFNGTSFVILDAKYMDCCHGVLNEIFLTNKSETKHCETKSVTVMHIFLNPKAIVFNLKWNLFQPLKIKCCVEEENLQRLNYFCSCRMPYCRNNNNEDKDMVERNKCREWFHRKMRRHASLCF
ncbi:uncharacterized protein LOC130662849 [Hydractinia symbiolongicarpus]|uniref:uncharacterized protein LOC130662849 n=1 Tax=Hydractinia symbiolongicarpus TaxID=13093 RepID=UPI00254ED4B2|nr:uncharacterized protein LOC130662849 [Hydractinia symbiolongicarpus]